MRASLGGKSDPRSEFALTDTGDGGGTGDAPVVLLLDDGVAFLPDDYISLGYTNYEVWCIGAVGGRGGDIIGESGPGRGGSWFGGAGGGGGIQRAVGLLADLPGVVPVVVGQPGSNGPDGNGAWTHLPVVDGTGHVIEPITFYPNPDYVAPQAGTDGGASSFGAIAQASGGKAGTPVLVIVTSTIFGFLYVTYYQVGEGGEGGLGGQLIAGGGASGGVLKDTSVVAPKPGAKAENGIWDGAIGSGGGGGYGGIWQPNPLGGGSGTDAGPGGQGNFSYVDTKVYGQREYAHGLTSADLEHGYGGLFDIGIGKLIVPGSGGGGRIPGNRKYGSRAIGYNPAGAVLIRLTKGV